MEINIRTETRTTIEGTAILDNGCFKVPVKVNYDGQEERFRTINIENEIRELPIPNGEYKITITLEKIG